MTPPDSFRPVGAVAADILARLAERRRALAERVAEAVAAEAAETEAAVGRLAARTKTLEMTR